MATAPTCRAVFYHLTRSGLVETVLSILPRALAQGWQVMVRAPNRAALEALDVRLWSEGDPGVFLAHGLEGGAHDLRQPVLLGQGAVPKGFRGLMLTGGAEASLSELEGLDRLWVLFDGADEGQMDGARALWKTLTTAGLHAQYWSDEGQGWSLKMEKVAADAD